MKTIQQIQLEAVDKIGELMADLTFETDPTIIQVKLGLIHMTSESLYMKAQEANQLEVRSKVA